MSFLEPANKTKLIYDANAEIASITGLIDEEKSKLYLAKFLENNIAYTMKLLTGADGKGLELYPFQEILLKMLFTKDNVLCIMGRGLGKTVCYNNLQYLIEKNSGFCSVKNIIPNLEFKQEDYFKDLTPLNLWNGKSWQPTSKILVQPQKDCAKIITSQGYNLSGSTNHLIKVLDENLCKIVWKRYHELQIGDKICIDRSIPEWELENIEDDEAYFVGLLLGDGCISGRSYSISSNDQETQDFCKKKYNTSFSKKKNTTCLEIRLNTEISQFYKNKYGFKEELSYSKKIPQRILKSKRAIKNCLQALFDTDGSISKPFNIDFCSTSQEMAEQVHTLLLTFGIISRIRLKKTKSKFGKAWIVDIFGQDAKKFIERIGFRLSRKQNIALEYLELNKKFNTNNDVVYGANKKLSLIKKSLKLQKEQSIKWHRDFRGRRKSQQKEISYDRFTSILNFLQENNINESLIEDLLEIKNSNYFFDTIKSIDCFKDDCIDFCDIPNGECYWSNGLISHNSTVAVWFLVLYCILYPGSKIGILSPSFRKSRDLFKGMQDLAGRKGATLLKQCIHEIKCAPDLNYAKIGTSEIFALPLGAQGDKIRGYRFNVVILDEAGFVPERIITSVIIPFLSTNTDPILRQQTKEREDDLIARGLMEEKDRIVYRNNKFLAFSSATYQFEYLYTMYKNYKKAILEPSEDQLASYGVFQMSYEAAPEGLLSKSSTENAKNSLSVAEFTKEYCAQFPSDSDSYYSMKKMEACTAAMGEEPVIEITGAKKQKYLVTIDPNSMSDASTADHFSISVFKLNEEDRTVALVHQFAACELNITDYIWYFLYILTEFNVVCVSIDRSGAQFINMCNESQMFKDRNIYLDFFEADFEADDKDYIKELNKARREYNLTSKKICYSQYFSNDWKRKANEHLQWCIEYKKIFFASEPDDNKFEQMLNINIGNFDKLRIYSGETTGSDADSRKIDFIDHQKALMNDVKHQCSLIELKVSSQGTHMFELPSNIRRIRGENQVRRDSYTALYMGVYMAKRYFDMMSTDERFNYDSSWAPYIL